MRASGHAEDPPGGTSGKSAKDGALAAGSPGGRPVTWVGGGGIDPREVEGKGVPHLRAMFHRIFGHPTASNNSAWLRRKLCQPRDPAQRQGPLAIRERDKGAAIWTTGTVTLTREEMRVMNLKSVPLKNGKMPKKVSLRGPCPSAAPDGAPGGPGLPAGSTSTPTRQQVPKATGSQRPLRATKLTFTSTAPAVQAGAAKGAAGHNGGRRAAGDRTIGPAAAGGPDMRRRLLQAEDLGKPALHAQERRVEIFWPDDGSWWPARIDRFETVHDGQLVCHLVYETGELETLSVADMVRDGIMSLGWVPAPPPPSAMLPSVLTLSPQVTPEAYSSQPGSAVSDQTQTAPLPASLAALGPQVQTLVAGPPHGCTASPPPQPATPGAAMGGWAADMEVLGAHTELPYARLDQLAQPAGDARQRAMSRFSAPGALHSPACPSDNLGLAMGSVEAMAPGGLHSSCVHVASAPMFAAGSGAAGRPAAKRPTTSRVVGTYKKLRQESGERLVVAVSPFAMASPPAVPLGHLVSPSMGAWGAAGVRTMGSPQIALVQSLGPSLGHSPMLAGLRMSPELGPVPNPASPRAAGSLAMPACCYTAPAVLPGGPRSATVPPAHCSGARSASTAGTRSAWPHPTPGPSLASATPTAAGSRLTTPERRPAPEAVAGLQSIAPRRAAPPQSPLLASTMLAPLEVPNLDAALREGLASPGGAWALGGEPSSDSAASQGEALAEPLMELLRSGSQLGDEESGELDVFGPSEAFALHLMQPSPTDAWLL